MLDLAKRLEWREKEAWLAGYLHGSALQKQADDSVVSRRLSGRLYLSRSGWLLLSVPNELGRGLFAAMDEPGIELPKKDGKYEAHISVMRPEEIETIPGGAASINERGKLFHYKLGPLVSVRPLGWEGVSRAWLVRVDSPELRELRRTYGLTPLPRKGDKELPFHITVAVRTVNVLYGNEVAKGRGESKAAGDRTIDQLLLAKQLSDQKQWDRKHEILRRLMLTHPREFRVDDDKARNYGVTHEPTGFQVHLPPRVIPSSVRQPAVKESLDWSSLGQNSFLLDSLKTTPVTWNQSKGVASNLWDHALKLRERAAGNVNSQYFNHRLNSAIDPQYKWWRLGEILKGRGGVVTSPVDKLIGLDR